MAQAPSAADKPTKKKSRWGRRVALFLGVPGLLLVVLLVFAPAIVGSVAPGFVASAAGGAIAGDVEVRSVSLSWLGEQRASGVRLIDTDGSEIGVVEARVTRGLLPLLAGSRDLGTVELSGSLAIRELAAGGPATNIERATASNSPTSPSKPSEASGGELRLPGGLAVKLDVTAFDVTYTAADLPAPVRYSAKGTASVRAGQPAEVDFVITSPDDAGSASLKGTVAGLVGADGVVSVEGATADVSLHAADLRTAVIDALTSQGGKLAAALGETIGANATVKATSDTFDVDADFASDGATADIQIGLVDGVVRSTGPAKLTGDFSKLRALLPAEVAAKLGPDGAVNVRTMPRVEVELKDLALRMPQGGVTALDFGTYDFRDAGGAIELRWTEAAGTLAKGINTEGPESVRVAPGSITLDARNLDAPAVQGGLSAELGGTPTGAVTIDLKASDLLDDNGRLRRDVLSQLGLTEGADSGGPLGALALFAGSVEARGVPSALAQPFLGDAPVDLASDVGPMLDASITLARGDDAGSRVAFSANAEHLKASGAVSVRGERVTGTDTPIEVTLTNPSGLAQRFAGADGPIAVRGVGGVTLRVPTLDADLSKLSGTPDLRAAKARVEVSLQEASLVMAAPPKEGAEAGVPVEVSVPTLTAVIDATDLGRAARITADGALVTGGERAALKADLRAGGLLDDNGAARGGMPTELAGEVSITGLATAALAPFVDAQMVDLPEDLGRALDVKLVAKATPAEDAGGLPPSDLELTAKAERLDVRGTARLDSTGVSLTGDGLTATLSRMGPLIRRMDYLPEGATVSQGTSVTVRVPMLAVPFKDGTNEPDMTQVRARADVRVNGLVLAGPAPLPKRADFDNVALSVEVSPEAPVQAHAVVKGVRMQELRGGYTGEGAQRRAVVLAQNAVLDLELNAAAPAGALTDALGGDGGTATIVGSLSLVDGSGADIASGEIDASARFDEGRPAGPARATLTLEDLDSSLMDVLAGQKGMLADALGGAVDLTLDFNGQLDEHAEMMVDSGTLKLGVTSPHLTTTEQMRVSVTPTAYKLDGPLAVDFTVLPELANRLLAVEGGEAPASLVGPVTGSLRAESFNMPRKGASARNLDAVVKLRTGPLKVQLSDGDVREYMRASANLDSAGSRGEVKATAYLDTPKGNSYVRTAGFDGVVRGLVGSDGAVSAETASLTGTMKLVDLPSELVDTLAHGGGGLSGLLGPRIDGEVVLTNLSRTGGTFKADAKSSYTSLTGLSGGVRDGRFVTDQPFTLAVETVDEEFGTTLAAFVPVFAQITKDKAQHAPATVVMEELSLAIGGEVTDHRMVMKLDPGVAAFQLDASLAKLIDLGRVVDTSIGNRFQAFTVTLADGVVNYDDLKLPLGEFTFPSAGRIDLVQKTRDMTLFVPAGQLIAEGADLGGGLGQLIGQAVNIPIRGRGALEGKMSWKIDPGGAQREKPDPGKLLDGVLRGIENRRNDRNESGGGSGGSSSGG